jgi:hypothetical protein
MADEEESLEIKLLRESRDEQRATNDYLARLADAAEWFRRREDHRAEALRGMGNNLPRL